MGKNVLSIMAGLTMASAAFVACTDYTYMDENTMLQGLAEEAYDQAFVEKYGKVTPTQCWDLTTYNQMLLGNAISGYNPITTRAVAPTNPYPYDLDSNDWTKYSARIGEFEEEGYFNLLLDTKGNKYYSLSSDGVDGTASSLLTKSSVSKPSWVPGDAVEYSNDWYRVEPSTLNWLNDNLQERYNNRHLGNPFELRLENAGSDYDFDIIPIYQGETSMNWSLHLVTKKADGTLKDFEIWRRSEGLTYYKYGEAEPWQTLDYSVNGGHVMNQNNVAGRKMTVSSSYINTITEGNNEFFFYLDIAKGNVYRDKLDISKTGYWDLAETGFKQRSDEGMMVALSIPTPSNVEAVGKKAMIIGCEDASMTSTDVDLNDVVFMIVAKNLPEVQEVIKKRYMVEDLAEFYNGASYETQVSNGRDFDFNDVVIDVTQVKYKDETVKQYAEFKTFCGTLPLKVKVGDTWILGNTDNWFTPQAEIEGTPLSKYLQTHPRGYLPDGYRSRIDITNWNPSTNNIVVYVKEPGNVNSGVFENNFPEMGAIPKIIAVDQKNDWQSENISLNSAVWSKWGEIIGNQITEISGNGDLGYDKNKLGIKLVLNENNLNTYLSSINQYVQKVYLGDLFANCTDNSAIIQIEVPANVGYYGSLQNNDGSHGLSIVVDNKSTTQGRVYTRIIDGALWEDAKKGDLQLLIWGGQENGEARERKNWSCYYASDAEMANESLGLEESKRLHIYYIRNCNDVHLNQASVDYDEFTTASYSLADNGGATYVMLNDMLNGCNATEKQIIFKGIGKNASLEGKFVGQYNGKEVSSPYIIANNYNAQYLNNSAPVDFTYTLNGEILKAAEQGSLKFEYKAKGCSFSGTNAIQVLYKKCNHVHVPYNTTIPDGQWAVVDNFNRHITEGTYGPIVHFASFFSGCTEDKITLLFDLPAGVEFQGKFSGDVDGYFQLPGINAPVFLFSNKAYSTRKVLVYDLPANGVAAAKNGTLNLDVYEAQDFFTKYDVKIYYRCNQTHNHAYTTTDLGVLNHGWGSTGWGSTYSDGVVNFANGACGWKWTDLKDCNSYSYVVVEYERDSETQDLKLSLTAHYKDEEKEEGKYEGVSATSGGVLALKLNKDYKNKVQRVYLETTGTGKITIKKAYFE